MVVNVIGLLSPCVELLVTLKPEIVVVELPEASVQLPALSVADSVIVSPLWIVRDVV